MIIYRDSLPILTIDVDNKTQLKQVLLGEDRVTCDFTLDYYFDLMIGDYILWRGRKYTILKQPSVDKSKTNLFKYNFSFDSHLYYLLDSLFFFDNQIEFSLLGDLEKFANLLITNLNRTTGSETYTLGSIPTTETKNLTFQKTDCLQALQTIASNFEVEYKLSTNGTTINFSETIGTDTGLTFEFKTGLRNIKRKKLKDKNVITNLYAFGGDRNIPSDYGSKRLKLDVLENNVNLFGKIEGTVTFEDVYPKREGTVSSIDLSNLFKFKDSSLDFDVNNQLIDGITAKVTFNTGYLAGHEFEVNTYSHSTKEFAIIEYKDTNGLEFPNSTLGIQVGDKYVLHDIEMPQSYIDSAETLLTTKANDYLSENSLPNVVYDITPDPKHLRDNNITLNIGDVIEVTDTDFDLTYSTRIISLSQSIANPNSYTIKVGDKVSIGYITQARDNQTSLENAIYIEREDRTQQLNRVRRTLLNIEELKDLIFDPDGYFDTDNIKPLSIETSMLSVGTKGQQFNLSGCLIQTNIGGDPAIVKIGNGVLSHFTISETGVRNWGLHNQTFNLIDPNSGYYIYAQCDKTGNSGLFVIDKNQILTNQHPNSYHFLLGVIHSVVDDVRGISLTYGQTTINGRFITTGRIQSFDQNNFFDLDQNRWHVGDGHNGIDWNVTNPDKLTIKGGIIQNPAGVQTPILSYRGEWDNALEYFVGDQVTFNGSTFLCDVDTSPGDAPTNTSFWTVSAIAGQNGDAGPAIVYRGDFSSSTPYYRTSLRRDVVKYNGVYWLKKSYYSGGPYLIAPFNSSDWESFGSQFSSVATHTLLAENASIADWIIKSGKISSQSNVSGTNTPKVILDGVNGIIKMSGLSSTSEYLGKSEIKDEGVFIESSGDYFSNAVPGALWIAGSSTLVERNMPNSGNNGRLLTAVYGKATNTSNVGCRTFGGYFVNLMARGFFTKLKVTTDTANYTVEDHMVTVVCKHTSGSKTIYLPFYANGDEREKGRIIIIKTQTHVTWINGNGRYIDGAGQKFVQNFGSMTLQYDGSEWAVI